MSEDNGDIIVLAPNQQYSLGEGSVLSKYPNSWWDVLAPSVRVSVGIYRRRGREPIRYIQIRDRIFILKSSLGLPLEDIIARLEASLGVKVSDKITVIEAELSREHIKEAIQRHLNIDDTTFEPDAYVALLKKIRKSKKA